MPKDSKVVVKGVNVRKNNIKPRKQGEEGGIIPVECAINSSKVNVVCPKCGKATRIEYKVEDGKKFVFVKMWSYNQIVKEETNKMENLENNMKKKLYQL